MSKNQIGMAVALVALIGVIFSAGRSWEKLAAESEHNRQQIEALSAKVDALVLDVAGSRREVMQLLSAHIEPQPQPRRTR